MVSVSTCDLTGRVVVITGAAGGLGSSYARECARRGAAVLLADNDEQSLNSVVEQVNMRGGIARGLVGDVGDQAHARALADLAVRKWGKISGWINNAGIQVLQPVDEVDAPAVELMVRVNVLGCIYGTGAAAAVMKGQGFGSIVNVTSGAQFGMEHLAAYGATKGAVASLTFAAALELRADGVQVNAISPLAATRMTVDGDEYLSRVEHRRVDATSGLADPESCAVLPAFLVSAAAEGITGQVIRFDGRTLCLIRSAGLLANSSVTADAWSAEDIAAAFASPLRSMLETPEFVSPARLPK